MREITGDALDGITILDCTQGIAGPFATQQLADMGADVIKIERPSRGDLTRQFPPMVDGHGALYLLLNRKVHYTGYLSGGGGEGLRGDS